MLLLGHVIYIRDLSNIVFILLFRTLCWNLIGQSTSVDVSGSCLSMCFIGLKCDLVCAMLSIESLWEGNSVAV